MSLFPTPHIVTINRDEVDSSRVQIGIAGVPTSVANGIRREILSSVRTVAMVAEPPEKSTIRIAENTSRLNNQFLALRISLIPVQIPPPNPSQGTDAIVTDRYEVRLDVTANDGDVEVTSDDLRIFDKKSATFLSPDMTRRVFSYTPIPIVPLRGPRGETPGETLRFTAGLVVGSGKDHACFSPVCCASYSMAVDTAAVKAAADVAVAEEGVEGTEREAGFRRAFENTTGLRYIKRDSNGDPVAFQFTIETVGQLDPVQVFQEGAIVLAKRVRAIRTEMATLYSQRGLLTADTKTIRSPRLELIVEGTEPNDEFLIRFQDEEHTLGALLQDMVLRSAKQNDTENYDKWFVGYRIPHPLTPVMVMRFHRDGLTLEDLFEGHLLPTLETVEEVFKDISRQTLEMGHIPSHPTNQLLGIYEDSGAAASSSSSVGMASAADAAAAAAAV